MTVNDRITEYLSLGGLFNPEMMDHEKVRDLLIACRDELTAVRAALEKQHASTDQIWNAYHALEANALKITTRATLDFVALRPR